MLLLVQFLAWSANPITQAISNGRSALLLQSAACINAVISKPKTIQDQRHNDSKIPEDVCFPPQTAVSPPNSSVRLSRHSLTPNSDTTVSSAPFCCGCKSTLCHLLQQKQ
jgi:hypothetical protein